MPPTISLKKCNGCEGLEEPLCVMVCPGDLMVLSPKTKKSYVRDALRCWDCMACVKVCPTSAIKVRLPYSIAYYKAELSSRIVGDSIVWTISDLSGKEERFTLERIRKRKE